MKNIFLCSICILTFGYATIYESTYTSITERDCKTTEVFENNMGTSQKCEKFKFFIPEIIDSDARMSITIHRRGIAYPQRYSNSVDASFSSLGSKIEWRYSKGESFNPYAFIARVNVASWNEKKEDTSKNISYLVVSKITPLSICVVGKIPPQKNQNLLARELADKARTMPCLLEEQNNREVEIKQVLTNYDNLNKSAKSQEAFRYVRDMGPLELALCTLKKPTFPIWRMRLRLYPLLSKKFPSQVDGYHVVADQINLSYALHDTLIKEYGAKNVDPKLKNNDPSKTYTLEYIVMRTPASFVNEATDLTYRNYLEDDACGLQHSCTQLWEDDKGNWSREETTSLSASPWESQVNTLPSMLRTLEKKAGWLQQNGWSTPEIPEEISQKRPWVELIIENHAGNGGGYLMEWYELVADDSIVKTLYRIYYDEASQNSKAIVQSAILCGRGGNTTKPTQICS